MRGLVLEGIARVEYRADLPDPALQSPSDVLVAVRCAGLCGSDLHPYEGREVIRFGVVPGHEAVGEVVAVGHEVRGFGAGDRVLAPFTTSCGTCWACRAALSSRCVRGALFGYAGPEGTPALHGGQAELIRVPLADGTLVSVPDGMSDEQALLLTDNFPTAWYATERADVRPDEVAVVVGLGAVGLCAVACAYAQGARAVIAIDPVADRRQRAEALGAITATPDHARDALQAEAEHGAGSVVEAAGTPSAQALAFSLVRPGGTLSVIAVQTAERLAFTPIQAYGANITVRFGRAPVRSLLDRILPRVMRGLEIPVATVVTHPSVPLEDGPVTYRRFAAREGGLVKALFRPR